MVVILPYDSAETSNTDSNLGVGFLYGFLVVAGSGDLLLEVLSLFNGPSVDSISRLPTRRSCLCRLPAPSGNVREPS